MDFRRVVAVCVMSVAGQVAQGGVDPELAKQDAFIAGSLVMLIEHQLGWARDSYELEVKEGVATVTLVGEEGDRRAQLQEAVPQLVGLQGLNIAAPTASAAAKAADGSAPPAASAAAPASAASSVSGASTAAAAGAVVETGAATPSSEQAEAAAEKKHKQVYSLMGLTPDTVPFPTGDLFATLLADPKQTEFFVSLRQYDTTSDNATLAAVGYGETFGLYRREGKHPGDGLQLSVSGGLFAQFNLDAPSDDLVNADYVIGIPVTYRRGPWSSRVRLYHQSSHLGDEYLLRARPERINLSFESLEMLLSYDWRQVRLYGGGEYLVAREPRDLDPEGVHAGFEFRGTTPLLWGGRLLGGVDLKSWREHEWSVDTSVKVGLEFGATQQGRRRLRVMAEAYDGYSPHGQFYEDEISYYGLGVYLGF